MATDPRSPDFVTLGMFIIDEFSFADEDGKPTGKVVPAQECIPVVQHRGMDFDTFWIVR